MIMKFGKWMQTAFLNGFLEEELYMMQPEGFIDPKGANKLCKLQRSIYGPVQASRSWNKCFDSVIKAYRFIQTFGEDLYLQESEWELCSISKTICR